MALRKQKKAGAKDLKISASPSFEVIDWDDPKNYNKLPLPKNYEQIRDRNAPGFRKFREEMKRMGLVKGA